MAVPFDESRLQRCVDSALEHPWIRELALCLESLDGAKAKVTYGGLEEKDQYFIASTTKLFTSALIFRLEDQGRPLLDDPAARYLPEDDLRGLNTHGGHDHWREITVGHLLRNNAGIPDYFQASNRAVPVSLERALFHEADRGWTYQEALARAQHLDAPFPPGNKRKALYSDTGYQLLGRIIERLYDASYAEVVDREIARPLGLSGTYVYRDHADQRPLSLRYKQGPLNIPRAMASFGPDGGVVSTASEQMVFLRAFFEGRLFTSRSANSLQDWRKIFFPLEYGIGLSRFKVPWFFMPFGNRVQLVGHSGLSGAFAFYCPEKRVYLTGTVNQVANPGLSFRFMMKVLNAI